MPTCNIKILDEVNCKCEDLDIATRRKCSNELKYFLPHAFHMPAYKLGRWDGMINFFTMGGGTQINLLDRIIPIIESAGYDITIEDNRIEYEFNIPAVDKDILKDITWPATHPTHANRAIELKEHQVAVINNFLNNLQCIQTVPTSGGKTLITGTLSKLVEPYGRSIIIVPSKQLVDQTLEDYLLLGLDAGAYYGDQKDWNKKHTICTWQSLDRLLKNTKAGTTDDEKTISNFVEGVTAIIIDEAHGAKADALKSLLTGIFRNIPIRWGLTGTIPKQEFEVASLIGSIGPVKYGVSAAELQEQGVLSNCQIEIIQTQEQLKFRNFVDETAFLTTSQNRINWLANKVEAVSESGNTLILVNRIQTGKELEKLIPGSVFISGAVKLKDRKEEYDAVATEDNKVIIATFGVAAVGINIPRLYNIIIFESGKSYIKVIQSLGRGLRRAVDKDHVDIFDICSATKYSKKHLTERKKFYKEMEYPFFVTKIDIG